ncbi:50S ribosomal protein L1 [Candidatus Daviesbacteria bacterium]|nr:50S ribosomal protein L1 [Candidatus Daviesbacteria bacterium]
MGKTKIKTIDDSDKLVEKLKEELGIEDRPKDDQPLAGKEEKKTEKTTEAKKPVTSQKRSKKYLEAGKDLDRNKSYPLPEALELVKKMSYSKFNGTLEAHINTIQTGIRGLVSLPHYAGKKLKILSYEGDDAVLEQIQKGKIDFDLVITTPQWMAKLTKVAKILGPRGLMPNPKNNTITDDIEKTIESFQTGKTEYKTEVKTPVIHLALGKLNQPDSELEANVKTVLQTIGKTRIKKVVLSPTMGPSVKLDLASL